VYSGVHARGKLSKDSAGHWRLVADLAGEESLPTYGGVAVELTAAPEAEADPKPYPLWIRPLACYERREAHDFEMSRYG
jgi:hypothetical protein